MANTTTAIQNGLNYQARFFWLNAFDLLIPEKRVAEVHYEVQKPKAFDDVVVHYETPIPRGGNTRIDKECYQVKWHVHAGGRFGYVDLTEPAFIGATRFSLLERLREASADNNDSTSFVLVTTDRIRDDDPLAELISKNDRSFLIERLFSTKTDNSRMGEVRKCWREHLGLGSDDELKPILGAFRITDGYRSLDELRSEVNNKAVAVGLRPGDDAQSDFRYDALAQQLTSRRINQFTRERFETMAKEEGIWVGQALSESSALPVAVHSFLGIATELIPTAPENTLFLTDLFRERYLDDGRDWQSDVLPRIWPFLQDVTTRSQSLRLILTAHASIAYLAGSILHIKSGLRIELAQKGFLGGTRIWQSDDGSDGPRLEERIESDAGEGTDVVVLVSLTHDVTPGATRYVNESISTGGTEISFTPPDGPGQQSVSGGQHAAMLAEQVSRAIRTLKAEGDVGTVHLFAACPNSFLFYLGQQHHGLGPVIVYEFDFDGDQKRGYQPSFIID